MGAARHGVMAVEGLGVAGMVGVVASLAPFGCERRAPAPPAATGSAARMQIAGVKNESWFTPPRGTPPSDVDLTNQVRQALSAEPTLSRLGRNVSVSVNGGVVTLTGDVEDEQQRENLRVAVGRVAGVRAFENRTAAGRR